MTSFRCMRNSPGGCSNEEKSLCHSLTRHRPEAGMSLSILILTLNEEVNLPDCLASVAWSDDIVVFDSHSSDRTVAIAQAAGARVVQRRFDNYAAHRNAALKEVTYRHPWLLDLDADERVTPELHREIIATLIRPTPTPPCTACAAKNFFRPLAPAQQRFPPVRAADTRRPGPG